MRVSHMILVLLPLALVAGPCAADAASGMPDLEREWTEESARPYWNSVKEPQGLRMDGSKWVDPALVPPLNSGNESKAQGRKKAARKAAKPVARQGAAPGASAAAAQANVTRAVSSPGLQLAEPALPPQTLGGGAPAANGQPARAMPQPASANAVAPAQSAGNVQTAQGMQNQIRPGALPEESIPPLDGRVPDKLGIYENGALVAPPPLH